MWVNWSTCEMVNKCLPYIISHYLAANGNQGIVSSLPCICMYGLCHLPYHKWGQVLTHWGRDKMTDIFQTTFPNAFSWKKIYELRLKFHWSLFLPKGSINIAALVQIMVGADQATSHYLNQWCLDYWSIYASLGLNELCYSDTPRCSLICLEHIDASFMVPQYRISVVRPQNNYVPDGVNVCKIGVKVSSSSRDSLCRLSHIIMTS